jgi:hypothetical protein
MATAPLQPDARLGASRLRRVAQELAPTLQRAHRGTGASSFSISVGLPFGVFVGLS